MRVIMVETTECEVSTEYGGCLRIFLSPGSFRSPRIQVSGWTRFASIFPSLRSLSSDENEERLKIAKDKILSDMQANISAVELFVEVAERKRDGRTLNVTLIPCHKRNVLRKLWETFQDQVTISADIKYARSSWRGFSDLASVQGMHIENQRGNLSCDGICASSTSFGNDNNPVVQVKISVDIPDDVLLNPPKKAMSIEEDIIPFAKKLLDNGAYSDVILVARNGVEIEGHKCLLAVCSPVLQEMFENDREESSPSKVAMCDLSEQGVKAFLRYVYYGDLKEAQENVDVAYDLLYAGHKYDVRGLEEAMISSWMDRTSEVLSVGLLFKIYMFVRNVGSAEELKAETVLILKGKLDELQSLQEYKDVFQKDPKVAMEIFRDFAEAASSA